ncbi:M24 family metallopeptidase [Anaerotruncus sp. 80]|uniref:M24 family metallopeptidase n=1 Tax=Anaerotruncus colihominis TaxID=169435 RepID=A0A845QID6_9FIRM|nr:MULTISPECIES: aminopeptidase P family N-terminal domain-containing protein [Anaerotruncus]NBH61224.1 M24 family metallopeptidase [Anaerotruncus colihominis]NCF01879.1 M24 family metallopeptidase [Anaerotruncus sp. 80]
MKQEITRLRTVMKEHGLDGYLVPTTDFHGSEYVNDYFKCRQYLSGFTGSNGTLLVTEDDARLWTDSRYFIQAAKQLDGTGISMMQCQQPGVPEIEDYLPTIAGEGFKLGFDGRIVSFQNGEKYAASCEVVYDLDLVDEIWENRPAIKASKIYALPDAVTGEKATFKLSRVQKTLAEDGIDYHLITSLEDIAWLFNLRGDDVADTPVFFAFALITSNDARLYILDETFDKELVPAGVIVLPYLQVFEDLKGLASGKCLLNKRLVSYSLMQSIPETVEVVNGAGPIELMKAIKNSVEIAATRHAHIKDGAAMANFIYWLKKNAGKMEITEVSASEYLKQCRYAQDGLIELSFETMAGYGVNAASIHYDTQLGHPCYLKDEGLLLVDSGGQYIDGGTTDITRTISLGTLTREMQEHYTMVLQAYLALEHAQFTAETTGRELDQLPREKVKAAGSCYQYDTGHGVGHILSVHEGPRMIGPTDNHILPGMITSNEPGIYIEGSHGVRIESELLCVENPDGSRSFECITMCPLDRAAILPELLTDEELTWVNAYHREVYQKLAPLLEEDIKRWLAEETKEITR